MNTITYLRYSPNVSGCELTTQVIECYRDIFADTPWNEWMKCSVCGKYWGKKDEVLLADAGFKHCDVPLGEFYERSKLATKLKRIIGEQASSWIAMVESRVIGFCWGYPATRSELEKKLGKLDLDGRVGPSEHIAFQNEVGVLPDFRGHKIAKAMVALRLKDFLAQGLRYGVVRVRETPEPSKTYLWYKKLGYEIIASYPEGDGRVVLGCKLNGLLSKL